MVVYLLRDPVTSRVRYIGVSKTPLKRFNSHIAVARHGRRDRPSYSATHCARWIKKLLGLGFKPLLEIVEEVSIENFASREQHWISHYRSMGEPLTNLTSGGEGTYGFRQSEEVRAKHSHARREYFKDPEARKNHSASITGHFVSEETKLKIGLSHKGRRESEATKEIHRLQMVARNLEYASLQITATCSNPLCRKNFTKQQERQKNCSRKCTQILGRQSFLRRWGGSRRSLAGIA